MINKERLLDGFLSLTEIEGVSKDEVKVMDEIKKRLDRLGIRYDEDVAGQKFGGNCGNLVARVPGKLSGDPFFFSAHVDTILSSNKMPQVKDGVVYSSGKTILGADDRAGVAVILEAVESAKEKKINHPDIELLFLVGEEIGLLGSKYLDYSLVKSKFGFVLDSSADPGKIIAHAPSHISCTVSIKGKSAHAAVAPETGVHAIKIAAEGIFNTEVGRVSDNTTVSIGVIKGGSKTNIIPDNVEIKGEIRSLTDNELPVHRKIFEKNFINAADKFGGEVEIEWKEEYNGFKIDESSHIACWIRQAIENAGIRPELIKYLGGSDANNFNRNEIPTVNLGVGFKKVHSNDEYIPIDNLTAAARIAFEVILISGKMSSS